MRRARGLVAVLAVVATLGVAAGCGGDDDGAEATTTEAPAVTTAPPTTTEAPATTTAETTPAGDVAAGEQFFTQTCSGCHLNGGRDAGGPGPVLAGAGLSAERITDQVQNGGGGMPSGLASGQDLQNVVAYVLSIQ